MGFDTLPLKTTVLRPDKKFLEKKFWNFKIFVCENLGRSEGAESPIFKCQGWYPPVSDSAYLRLFVIA
jgi:hypothetical protein